MTVSPQNALFIYKYACVLEDPGHPPNAQPVFQMRLLDQADLDVIIAEQFPNIGIGRAINDRLERAAYKDH